MTPWRSAGGAPCPVTCPDAGPRDRLDSFCLRVGDAERAALGRRAGPARDRLPAAQQAHAGEEAFGDKCFVLAF